MREIDQAAGSCFYDPASGIGGTIEASLMPRTLLVLAALRFQVFEEDGVVVHRSSDGRELRWKILKMVRPQF